MLVYIFFSVYLMLAIKTVNTQEEFMKPIFNAMTPYFWVKDVNRNILENENSTVVYDGQSCNIKSLNVLFRHSARFPSLEWINKMDKVNDKLKDDSTVISKQPFIVNWTNPFPKSKEYSQSIVGDMEMLTLGNRFSKRFQNFFNKYRNDILYTFSGKTRTQTSMKKWYKGLIDSLGPSNSTTLSLSTSQSNELIRFYDYCKRYIQDVDKNTNTLKELNNFLMGKEMMDVTENVRKRLGSNEVNAADVVTMQQICAFELGMFNTSDWCKLFEMNDLLTIDYLIDLRNYWEMGYGYDINWQVSCPYTSKIFRNFQTTIERESWNNWNIGKVLIDFGHTDTILPLYTAFGLFKDPQLLLSNNFAANKNRQFRTSRIAPFSANFGIGLYKCESTQEYIVKLFVNEEEVINPACNQTLCTYEQFKTFYSHLASCDFAKICGTSEGCLFSYSKWILVFLCYLLLK